MSFGKSAAICMLAMTAFGVAELRTLEAEGRSLSDGECKSLFGGGSVSGRECGTVDACSSSTTVCQSANNDSDLCGMINQTETIPNSNMTACNTTATVEVQCTEGADADCSEVYSCEYDPGTKKCNAAAIAYKTNRTPSSCSEIVGTSPG